MNETEPIPIISVELMRASDAHTIEHLVDDVVLMDRAGRGIAALCHNLPGPYAILCGPGNNGGDGYVAARCLARRAQEQGGADAGVSVFFTKEPASASSCHHRALLDETGVSVEPFDPECDLSAFGTVVDCLLGTGFDGIPRGPVAQAIAAVNAARQAGARVVSADINSGVNGDTGRGELAVESDLTVSIGFLKTGMLACEMGRWTRHVVNVDIGIELAGPPTATALPAELPAWIDPVIRTVD